MLNIILCTRAVCVIFHLYLTYLIFEYFNVSVVSNF